MTVRIEIADDGTVRIQVEGDHKVEVVDADGQRLQPPAVRLPGGDLMAAKEVEDLLGLGLHRVWAMSRRAEIPTVRIGPRALRFRRQDIEAYVDTRTTRRPRGTQS